MSNFDCDFDEQIYRTSRTISDLHDAVFVVGALDETIMLRGMRYHPIDIENSVMRSHKKIAEWYRKTTFQFFHCPSGIY